MSAALANQRRVREGQLPAHRSRHNVTLVARQRTGVTFGRSEGQLVTLLADSATSVTLGRYHPRAHPSMPTNHAGRAAQAPSGAPPTERA